MRYSRLWLSVLRMCWRRDRTMTAVVLVCHVLHSVAFAGVALAIKALVDATADGVPSILVIAAAGTAVAFATDWLLGETAFVLTIHLVDRVGLTAIEPEIIAMCTGLEDIGHLERPEFLDRITAVRGQGWAIVESAWSVLLSMLVGARLVITILLLGGVDPALLLLAVLAVAQLWLDKRGRRAVSDAEIATAEDTRLQRRLFEILTAAASAKEVRVTGAREPLVRLQRQAWERVSSRKARARAMSAAWSTAGWAVFAGGYLLALYLMLTRGGSAGDLVLAVTVGAQLRNVVETAMQYSSQATEAGRVLEPYLWLREYAATATDRGSAAPPARLTHGIVIDNMSFTYPGTERPAVRDLSVRLPAGSVVAVVGEHGSGKTTLVKLLAKLYRPSSGSIRVDGVDLGDIRTQSWWAAMSAAFQDFGRYQTSFAESVRLGDTNASPEAVRQAIEAADAGGLVERLPDGIDTTLGKQFGGVELSEGQWQKVALARASVRPEPLLFVLDEPTASLDVPSEHAIFLQYMRRSRTIAESTGAITVVVSHRYSTVAEADLILVMHRGELIELGSHRQLLAEGGHYADAYRIQASAYDPVASEGGEGTRGSEMPSR